MTKSVWSSVLVICAASVFAMPSFGHGGPFSTLSYQEASQKAGTDGKLIVIDFSASWCGPCHKMEKTTWSDKAVQAWLNKNAIALQVDVDQQKELAAQYKIDGMPCVVIVAAKPKLHEIDRRMGYQPADQFLSWLRGVEAKH